MGRRAGGAQRLGTPYAYTHMVRRVLNRSLELAGLRRIRFHDLRHTCASTMIANGEDSPTVPKALETRNIISQSFSIARHYKTFFAFKDMRVYIFDDQSSRTSAEIPRPQVPSSAVTLTPNLGHCLALYSWQRFLKRGNLDMGLATSICVGLALRRPGVLGAGAVEAASVVPEPVVLLAETRTLDTNYYNRFNFHFLCLVASL